MQTALAREARDISNFSNGSDMETVSLAPGMFGTRWAVTWWVDGVSKRGKRYDAQATVDGILLHVNGSNKEKTREVFAALKALVKDNPYYRFDHDVMEKFWCAEIEYKDYVNMSEIFINADFFCDNLDEIPF